MSDSSTPTKAPEPLMTAAQFCGRLPPSRRKVRLPPSRGRPSRVVLAQTLNPRAQEGSLKGTADEIFVGIIMVRHKHEMHTLAEWRTMLEELKGEPVHPEGIAAMKAAKMAAEAEEAPQHSTQEG